MKLFLVTGAAATTAALTVNEAFKPKIIGYTSGDTGACGCTEDVGEAEPASQDAEADT